MVLSKQNNKRKKKKKGRSRSCESQAHRAGVLADHELCTDWARPVGRSVSDTAPLGAPPAPSVFDVCVPAYVYQIYVRRQPAAAATRPSCGKAEV